MKAKDYYVVEITDLDYPQYLDGFRANGDPVWTSGLQSIDPFMRYQDALDAAKKAGGDVRVVRSDDHGYTQLA